MPLHQKIDLMAGKRLLIIGDLILDRYVWGDVTRISQEAPVPVVEVTDETVRVGGAANVAHNAAGWDRFDFYLYPGKTSHRVLPSVLPGHSGNH